MDSTDSNLVNDNCERLMNTVVDWRKRIGKMCVDYEQKTSLMENRILNLQIETLCYKFKPKHPIPTFENEDFKHYEEFSQEMSKKTKRIEDLRMKIKNTQEVVLQLKADSVGKRLREPLTADVLLAKAKDKKVH